MLLTKTKVRRAPRARKTDTDVSTLVPDSTKRRVYAECELKKAFLEMIKDIIEHNSEYHHHTPNETIQGWSRRLADWEMTLRS